MNDDDVSREAVIAQRAADSAEDFMENGPRLWVGRRAYVLARGDGKVMLGGLGGLGIGVMWSEDDGRHADDPTYADAPHDPDRLDHVGSNGRATIVLARGDGRTLLKNANGKGEVWWWDDYGTPRPGADGAPYEPDRVDDGGKTGRAQTPVSQAEPANG